MTNPHVADSPLGSGAWDGTTQHAPQKLPETAEFAGFWRRAWSDLITTLLWIAAAAAVTGVIVAITQAIGSQGTRAITIGGGVAAGVASTLCLYVIAAKPLSTSGATWGMRELGLRIHRAGDARPPTLAAATLRTALDGLPAIVAGALPYAVVLTNDRHVERISYVALIAAIAIRMIGVLWMLVNERRQTTWDVVARTTVTAEREPSWWAVAAFVVAATVPYAAYLNVQWVGTRRIRSDYEHIASVGDVLALFGPAVPVLLVALVALGLATYALRSTTWATSRAGRGLARFAIIVSQSIPVLIILAGAFGGITRLVTDRQADSCSDERRDITRAVESFQTLNGTPPQSIDDVMGALYLDDDTLSDRWTLAGTVPAPIKTGVCAGS